jgi:hypothetical protein
MMSVPHAYDAISRRRYDSEQGRDPEATVYVNCDEHDLPIRVRPRNGVQTDADIYSHSPVECCKSNECHRQACEWYKSAVEITGTVPIASERHETRNTKDTAAMQCWLRPWHVGMMDIEGTAAMQCRLRSLHVGMMDADDTAAMQCGLRSLHVGKMGKEGTTAM